MASRIILDAPATLLRRDGEWQVVTPVDGAIPQRAGEGADRTPPGELGGEDGRLFFSKGHAYEISPAIAESLADIVATADLMGNGHPQLVRLGAHVRRVEVPDEVTHRIHAAPDLFTRGQQAVLDALEARIATLEAAQMPRKRAG